MKEVFKGALFAAVVGGGLILFFCFLNGCFDSPDPNQATMPDEFLITRLDQVPEGKEVHVCPYSIEVDDNKKIWVGKTSKVDDHSLLLAKRVGDYVEIRVQRQHINARKEYFKWKQTTTRPRWISHHNFPVSKFVILEEPEISQEKK